MTVYYCGPGGAGGNAGTSWGARKATLNQCEDIPVVAGDTVYVGPGSYLESLTVDVSGSVGSPITYIGDYTGANTDGVGGVVRITGSDNNITATRASCVTATSKDYRTLRGFTFDITSSFLVSLVTACSNWIIEDCHFLVSAGHQISMAGTGTGNTVRRCIFRGDQSRHGIFISHSSTVDNAAHVIENCLFVGGNRGITDDRVGGITVRNSLFLHNSNAGVRVATAVSAGQTVTVNNCILYGLNAGFWATTTGEIVENYNSLFGNSTDRTNTATGANSNAYPPLFDARWFFEMVNGGNMLTPFDMASYSALIDVAGTSPPSADMRGTTVQGSQREWGALEYDSTLDIEAGAGGTGGMGGIFGSIVK